MFKRRPWGWYLVVWYWAGIKVKLLYFKRGGSISLQRHFKREEYWRVLFGSGIMSIGHLPTLSHRRMQYYINSETWHKYYATTPTLVLETQCGVCEEGDIERA